MTGGRFILRNRGREATADRPSERSDGIDQDTIPSWTDQIEAMARTRLPPDLVRSIFTSAERPRVLIALHGIDRQTIWAIQSRTTYARVTADLIRPERPPRPQPPPKKPRLKPEQIRAIFVSTALVRELVSQFNVSTFTVYAIQSRSVYSEVTADLPDVVRVRRRGPVPKPKLKQKPEPETYRPNVVIRLTDAEIRAIYTSSASDQDEARKHNVKTGLIRAIRDRSIFSYTTMDLRRPRPSMEPDQPDQKLGPSRGRFPPTPGVDFQSLASAHRDLERPKGIKRAIRIKPGYRDAPVIIAYLIPLDSRN